MSHVKRIAQNFSKHAHHYERFAEAQQQIGAALMAMIATDDSKKTLLDLGCGTGNLTTKLCETFANLEPIGIDFATQMTQEAAQKMPTLQANASQLPLADESVDMIFSNLMLQWLDDFEAVFAECWRVCKPGGTIYFSTLGQDTLHEAQQALATIGRGHHINTFHDIQQLGDYLHYHGWRETVLCQEWLQLHYSKPEHVFYDIKNIGANTVLTPSQQTGLLTPRRWRQCLAAYPKLESELYPATYHAILLRAIKTTQPPKVKGEISVPIKAISRFK